MPLRCGRCRAVSYEVYVPQQSNLALSTNNGGISLKLTGDKWDGTSLDIATTNGGISIRQK